MAGGELVLTFLEVLEDSRCPKGEQCITAGRARIALELAVGTAPPARVELFTSDGTRDADVEGFRTTLEDVRPYPVVARPIQPGEYRASLTVRKLH